MTGTILKRYKRLLSLIAVPLLILALTLSPAVGADDDGDIKVKVVGDEQLLDDVWDKVESTVTDMPEDAVMTGKYVIGPTEGNGWTSERTETYCSYYFSHIVDGKKVPGDRFVVIINADTLERTPVWFYTPLNEVGSIEAVLASKRPMIWDGSRAWEGNINFLPPYEVPAGYSYEAPGYENGGHGMNAAGMNDIPVADDYTVLGDEELLDSVWEKACTDIELPDGAVLVSKAVIAPKESNIGGVPAVTWVNTPSEEFGKTHCSYRFGHLVDGELVDGDKYVIAINADTLERVPIVQRTPYYITGSVEASDASARPMIWDGSCPTIHIGPFHEVRAGYSYEAPGYENGGHGVNAASINDIPVADDCTVLGDEELLDSVWEKACTDIELPEGAILTIKAVIAPEESIGPGGVPTAVVGNKRSEKFGETHCVYYFQHLVDGELVDGDRYVIKVNADTLELTPAVERIPYYITGSIEASDASARAMIWDGSCPTIRIGPFYEVPACYSYEAPGYENGGHDVNAAGMDDIPVADDCTVLGDEELLDSVWEKACTDIELPDGAVLTIKAVIAPEDSIGPDGVPNTVFGNKRSEKFGETHCTYYFSHLVDGKLIDGDRYVVVINADTLERIPIVEWTPPYITGSLEASYATARAMIWDGSCPTLRIGPFHEVRARYSYDILRHWNGNRSVGWETRGQNAGVEPP